ncbi:MAG: CHAT domain-containing tetratricopeptide repeat protein [Bacteroidota bacterium]
MRGRVWSYYAKYLGWVVLFIGLNTGWSQSISLRDSASFYIYSDSLLDQAESRPSEEIGDIFYAWKQELEEAIPSIQYRINYCLGEYHQFLVQPDSAIPYYQCAAELARKIWGSPNLREAESMNGEAICLFQSSRFDEALAVVRGALAARKALLPPGHSDVAQGHNNVGIMAYKAGQTDTALFHMAKAVTMWEADSTVKKYDVLAAYNNLGIINRNFGRLYEALAWYEKILVYADELPWNAPGNSMSQANAYNNIAVAYRQLGNHEQSIRYLRQSIALDKIQPSRDQRSLCVKYNNLGATLLDSRQPDSALVYFKKRVELQQQWGKAPKSFLYDGYMQLSRAYLALNQPRRALKELQTIQNPYRELYPQGHQRLSIINELMGTAYLALGDSSRAETYFQKSLDWRIKLMAPDNPQLRLSRVHLAKALWKRNPQQTTQILEQAMREAGDKFAPVDLEIAKIWAEWLAEQEKWNESYQAYQLALGRLDTLRRTYQLTGSDTRLREIARPIQNGTMRALLTLYQQEQDQTDLQLAWQVSEASRALRLRENLQALQASSFGNLPENLVQADNRLRADLVRLNRQVSRAQNRDPAQAFQLRKRYFSLLRSQDSLLQLMAQANPEYYQLRYSQTPSDLAQVKTWLKQARQDLVEFYLTEKEGWALVIHEDQLHVVALPHLDSLSSKIDALRASIYAQNQPVSENQDFIHYSRELYDLLWKPILATVPTLRNQVIIIPDGPLGYLPFGLLLDQAVAADQGWASLPYLLKRVNLSYAPSAEWLINVTSQTSMAEGRLLSLAPDFEGSVSTTRAHVDQTLIYHRKEAEQIAKMFQGKSWLGPAANERDLKEHAGKYRILHFSSHAAVNDQNPLYSFVQLSPKETEDGRLEIAELFGLRLQAELVVLSACETAMGQYQPGEGILNLAQGFSYAGARSVLTTWWPVNDATSAQLMERFYQGLAEGQTRSEALRNAQLAQIDSGDPLLAHPFFWAGYQLSGQPGALPLDFTPWPWGWIGGVAILLVLLVAQFRRKKQ